MKTTKNESKRKFWMKMGLMLILLLLSIPLCALWGSADVSYGQTAQFLLSQIVPFFEYEVPNWIRSVIWELRIPRILLGIAVGGGLSICGVAMQALTRNVLAEPYILGVSSGASAMAVFALMFGGTSWLASLGVSGCAFLGALASLLLVYTLSISKGSSSSERLLLSGIAVSMVLNALTQFFIQVAPNSNNVKSALYWMMGSLASARWNNVMLPVGVSLLGCVVLYVLGKSMNLMSQGDESATTMGVNVPRMRKALLVIVSMITGVLVSASGCIGFVGLMIPHIVRMLFGADHRRVIPASFLMGAMFLVWMDVGARVVLAPSEMSIGILTAFCGGPFFVWLLRHRKRA